MATVRTIKLSDGRFLKTGCAVRYNGKKYFFGAAAYVDGRFAWASLQPRASLWSGLTLSKRDPSVVLTEESELLNVTLDNVD